MSYDAYRETRFGEDVRRLQRSLDAYWHPRVRRECPRPEATARELDAAPGRQGDRGVIFPESG
jgi:hypothetical protein